MRIYLTAVALVSTTPLLAMHEPPSNSTPKPAAAQGVTVSIVTNEDMGFAGPLHQKPSASVSTQQDPHGAFKSARPGLIPPLPLSPTGVTIQEMPDDPLCAPMRNVHFDARTIDDAEPLGQPHPHLVRNPLRDTLREQLPRESIRDAIRRHAAQPTPPLDLRALNEESRLRRIEERLEHISDGMETLSAQFLSVLDNLQVQLKILQTQPQHNNEHRLLEILTDNKRLQEENMRLNRMIEGLLREKLEEARAHHLPKI